MIRLRCFPATTGRNREPIRVTLHDAISFFLICLFFHENCFFIVELFIKKRRDTQIPAILRFTEEKLKFLKKKSCTQSRHFFFSVRFIL